MKMSKVIKVVRKVIKVYAVISTASVAIELIKARGLKKENDKALLEEASLLTLGIAQADELEYIKVGEDVLSCKYNPYSMFSLGYIGSVALVLGNGTVIYDDNFRRMSKSCQVAILAHELGHIKHQHKGSSTYMKDRAIYVLTGRVLPMELEADAYAVSIVGKDAMIEALNNIARFSTSIVNRLEIRNRIKAIKSL